MGAREVARRDGEGADVIVVAMRDGNGVDVLLGDVFVQRQPLVPFEFGVRARVHEQTVAVDFDKPRAGADVGVWIEIDDPHDARLGGMSLKGNHHLRATRPRPARLDRLKRAGDKAVRGWRKSGGGWFVNRM